MKLVRTLRGSCRLLLSQRLRSLLVVTAVALGVALVFVVNALGSGASAELLRGVDSSGPRLLVVRPATTKNLVARRSVGGLVTSLRLEDCSAIARLDTVELSAPFLDGQLRVRSNGVLTATKVVGTSPALLKLRGYAIEQGRVFDPAEEYAAARVAVLGKVVAQKLFPEQDPVGKIVRIRGISFDVIGLMRAKGASADGSDPDNQILVPVKTALRRIYDQRALSLIYVSVAEGTAVDLAIRQIREVLRKSHRLERPDTTDDFAIQTQPRWIGLRANLATTLGTATNAIAFVALLIGTAGVTGLMLLSVKERTTEIGLRMAVGATPFDIGLQFFAESFLISFCGGIVGVVVGFAGTWAIARWTEWQVLFSYGALGVSFGLACATGVLSGLIPAINAASVPPMQAFAQE